MTETQPQAALCKAVFGLVPGWILMQQKQGRIYRLIFDFSNISKFGTGSDLMVEQSFFYSFLISYAE
jgi:hypothetical protein